MGVLALLALVVVATTVGAANNAKLIQATVVHRACGTETAGFDRYARLRCAALGKSLRATYASILPTRYNSTLVTSLATEIPVTTQSAETVLLAAFEGQPRTLIFTNFTPASYDFVMRMWDSWPSEQVRGTADRVLSAPINSEVVNASVTELNKKNMADWLGITYQQCNTLPMDCVLRVGEKYEAATSTGASVPAWVPALLPVIKRTYTAFLDQSLGYFPKADSTYSANIGSYGYPLADALADGINAKVNGEDHTASFQLVTGHAKTQFAFYTAAGVWSADAPSNTALIPQLGEAAAFNVYDLGNGQFWVNATLGRTSQTAHDAYEYSFTPLGFQCNASGSVYWSNATGRPMVGCPLNDFMNVIRNGKPWSAVGGPCYAEPADLAKHDCVNMTGAPTNTVCKRFRNRCPAFPCGGSDVNFVPDFGNGLACSRVSYTAPTNVYGTTVVAITAPALLIGAVIGYFVLGTRLFKKDESEEQTGLVAN